MEADFSKIGDVLVDHPIFVLGLVEFLLDHGVGAVEAVGLFGVNVVGVGVSIVYIRNHNRVLVYQIVWFVILVTGIKRIVDDSF